MKSFKFLCLSLLLSTSFFVSAEVPVKEFFKHNEFGAVEISPGGEYLAVTMGNEESTNLVILTTKDKKIHGAGKVPKNHHVGLVRWVSDNRVAFTISARQGKLVTPRQNGALYFMNADGTKIVEVAGNRNIVLVDSLDNDDEFVLAQTQAMSSKSNEAFDSTVFRINVNTGKLVKHTIVPMVNASVTTDNQARTRLAITSDDDMMQALYQRNLENGEWSKIHDERELDSVMSPIGFDEKNDGFYASLTHKQGPDSIVYVRDGKQSEVFRDKVMNPMGYIFSPISKKLLGVVTMPDRIRNEYFDYEDEETKVRVSLEKSFPNDYVSVDSMTKDGSIWVIETRSDRDPGQFYLLDRKTSKVSYLLSRAQWIDPEKMSPMKQITFKARDGLELRGFLTIPKGSDGKNLPLIVNPHGGPHGPFDIWRFNDEVQLFANRGYAVISVNYRGSGGYGRSFERFGYREWSGKMQDDVADVTRWAIDQGIADKNRVCIYGASYGAYSALVGATRDVDMYRCAIGFVGVYDLQMMYKNGDIPERKSGINYLKRVLGDEQSELVKRSPAQQAKNTKVPIYLAAGGADRRTPPSQSKLMYENLKAAGKQVEYDVTPGEGHGFYRVANNEKLYSKMLAFFDKHIGSGAKSN